jgi:hypothetical protein
MKSMKEWLQHLDAEHTIDMTLRLISVMAISIWLFFHGMVYQESYDLAAIELSMYPWWNILLIALVAIAAAWCPRVGIVAALAVFIYLSDMYLLTRREDEDFEAAMEEEIMNAQTA